MIGQMFAPPAPMMLPRNNVRKLRFPMIDRGRP